jgi:hypothetical protein
MKPLAVFLFIFLAGGWAQTTGDLHGTVTDTSAKPVEGARVSATFENTAAVRDTVTDARGEFRFASVPVGQYTVAIDADAFKSYVQRYLQVSLGHVVELRVELEAGESTQVLALEAPLVERSSTQLGAVAASRAVQNLPLNTRDTYQLLQLQPGVQSQQGSDLFAGSEKAGVVSVNGGRGRANNFNVNGGDANDLFMGAPGVQPSPDTIEEFRVLTNTFDAEHGRNSGAVVNVVTRAGTNDFHGSVLEFFRNRTLNTRGFFDTEKPQFNQNQYGGTFGGPLARDRA